MLRGARFQSEKPLLLWWAPSDSSRSAGRGAQSRKCRFSGDFLADAQSATLPACSALTIPMPAPPHPPIKYLDPDFNRAPARREDAAWIAQACRSPAARCLAIWRERCLLAGIESCRPRAARLALSSRVPVDALVFLGIDHDQPLFAIDLSNEERPPVADLPGAAFVDLRRYGPLLADRDAALLAYARGMLHWHRHHRYCGRCGSATASEQGGHRRSCRNPDCGLNVFPRTDPAVIVLVEHPGDDQGPPRCLLGRSSRFPPGVYSTLAGFVEPGESLEQTVRREVLEEAGVEVGEVRYLASQPWPFPSSLMLGFHARALSTTIHRHDQELEDARWFTLEELARAGEWGDAAELCLPRRDSIARYLIETWMGSVRGR